MVWRRKLTGQSIHDKHRSRSSYTPALYLGNGIPDTWIASGQTISMSNITENYNTSSGQRATFGVSFSVSLNIGENVSKPASIRFQQE